MKYKQLIKRKESYQDKRDNEKNWQMICEELDDAGNLLDVACNAGYYSIKAAEKGVWGFGFDISADSLKTAKKRAEERNLSNVVFSQMALDPNNVLVLPDFDVVLCLSVFHHFVRLYGEDDAKSILVRLFSKSKKKMFLQIPSKIGKYTKDFSVDFCGNEQLIRRYVKNIFKDIDGCRVDYIGKNVEKPPTEEYRYLYAVIQTKAEGQ